jgi:Cu-Zn family superoxide dismutase
MAVAVIESSKVKGEVLFTQRKGGVSVDYVFRKLPPGLHGFHIHRAGDLRGEGCKGACDHWSKKPAQHGGPPGHTGPRHTGDLGNLSIPEGKEECKGSLFLKHVFVEELYGRSVIVHEDEDDYGRGPHEDSKTTGHSGARIGCAIIGRLALCSMQTRKKTSK